MDKDSFSFVIYMIHACSNKWRVKPSKVYQVLRKSGCMEHFLVKHYDILHTQGTQYVVEDIQEYLNVRGIEV